MSVTVEKVGTRIYLRSPWKPGMPEKCKSVSGARWSPTAKAWTYPCDLEVCRMLRDVFGDELTIGPDLTVWAKNQVSRERALRHIPEDLPNSENHFEASPPTRVGTLTKKMSRAVVDRGYQCRGARWLAYARTALLADEPGLGKTVQTLAGLIEGLPNGGRVLVLAPRTSVTATWLDEIDKWMEDYQPGYSLVSLANKTPLKMAEAVAHYFDQPQPRDGKIQFLLANAEIVRVLSKRTCGKNPLCNGELEFCEFADKHKGTLEPRLPQLFQVEWDAVVADETHKWLINANRRSKGVSQVGRGFDMLKTVPDGMRIALSGTPLKGKKHNLFGTIHWLRPDVYTSKWAWIERYFEVDKEGYGRTIGGLKDGNEKSFYRALDSVMLRRTKKEVREMNPAWMPPEKIYHEVWVDMDPKQAKAYKAMQRDCEVKLKGGMLQSQGVLSELTRLKQFAGCYGETVVRKVRRKDPETGESFTVEEPSLKPSMPSAKFDWLLEFLEARGIEAKAGSARTGDMSDEVHKVVVASQFTQFINIWSAELTSRGIPCYVLTGETKDADRRSFVQAFQKSDDVRVFFINTAAGGASITLDAADDIVLMDETYVPDDQLQVEDRVHRASNVKHQVNVWYVRARGTIEEGIAKLNIGKSESNHIVLDAGRALKYVQTMYGTEIKK